MVKKLSLPILVKKFVPELDENGKPIEVAPIPIKEFIDLVKKVENGLNVSQEDTQRMITRIRKVFYGKPEWDQFVITDEDATQCQPIDEKYPLKIHKIVRLVDDYCLDIGHVFAGLDALQYPRGISIDFDMVLHGFAKILWDFDTIKDFRLSIDSNAAFATWLGDLGDLLKEKLLSHNGNLQMAISDNLRPAAPGEDMLGNIDAYAIYHKYFNKELKKPPQMKLSEILHLYYIQEGFKDLEKKERYLFFAKEIDLEWDATSRTFNDESKSRWIERFAGQLRFAGFLCMGEFCDENVALWNKLLTAKDLVAEEDGTAELEAFLAGLKALMK